MDLLGAHARAQDAFAEVLAGVGPDQYGASTPCSEWTVRDLIEHVVVGNNHVGAPGKPVGDPELDTLPAGADHTKAFTASAERAQATFAAPDGLTRGYELGFGTLPGSAFIALRTTDVLVHAWDLARATGQSVTLDDELAQQCLDRGRALMQDSFRGPGRPFAAEQPCPPGRPAADQLAAFMGRAVT